MLDIEAIRIALIQLVVNTTNLAADEVIIANQNAPKPSGSYASVFVTPSLKVGLDRVTYANEIGGDLDETLDGHREVKVSFNFFKTGAFDNASTFLIKLQATSIIDYFKANGLGFVSVSEIRDLSEVHKNLWEERAQFDLTLYALSNFTETVSAIASAEVIGVAESGNKSTNININIVE